MRDFPGRSSADDIRRSERMHTALAQTDKTSLERCEMMEDSFRTDQQGRSKSARLVYVNFLGNFLNDDSFFQKYKNTHYVRSVDK
jgi:hypothetical protein